MDHRRFCAEDVLLRGAAPLSSLVGERAVRTSGVGTFAWDLRSGELAVDPAFAELYGFGGDDPPTHIDAVGGRVHPHDAARISYSFQRELESHTDFEMEYRVLLPDGRTRWVLSRGRLVRGPDGVAVGAVGAAFDATVRQEGEARTTRLLEAMPTALFLVDHDWLFTYVNAAAEQLLGRPREEILGRNLWEMFPDAVGSQYDTHYRHAVRTGEHVVFDADATEEGRAYEVRAWPGPDGLAVYLQDVTAERTAQETLAASARRADLLARVSHTLAGSMDATATLADLARDVVPDLADWAIVTLVDDDGRTGGRPGLRDVATWHVDPDQREVARRYAQLRLEVVTPDSPMEQALRAGRTVHLTKDAAEAVAATLAPGEARDLLLRLAPATTAILPLVAGGRPLGLLSLLGGPDRPPAGPEDIRLAEEVAARAALALDHARMFRQQTRLSERLQRAMLTEPIAPDHLRIEVRYVPAAEAAQVGGDWYDSFLQEDGATVLVIGDVVGHDHDAAAAMGQLRSVLRGIAVASGASPAELVRRLDAAQVLLRTSVMATLLVARIEQDEHDAERGLRTVRWTTAGHPPPLLVQPDGTVEVLDGQRPDILLGVEPGRVRHDRTVQVVPGSTLLLYTDGLVERRGQPVHDGIALLRQTVADLADRLPQDPGGGVPLARLADEVLDHLLPDDPQDDVALLLVRFDPEPAASPGPGESAGDRAADVPA